MSVKLVLIGGKLALICAVAALVLALVGAVTTPVIEQNRIEALNAALSRVSGGGTLGERTDVGGGPIDAFYPVYASASADTVTSYIVLVTGNGYGGEMSLVASIAPDGEIRAAELMLNQETPGLGKKAETAEYMEMFVGTGAANPVPTSKNDLAAEDADAVTGATLTFLGVANALEAASSFVEDRDGA